MHTFQQANKLAAKRKAHDDASKADKKKKKKKCWFLYVLKCFFFVCQETLRSVSCLISAHCIIEWELYMIELDYVIFKFAQTGFQ